MPPIIHQVEIADRIVAHKADYLLALKGNQPALEADVEDYFRTAPAEELVCKTSVEKGHGRIETRTYRIREKLSGPAALRQHQDHRQGPRPRRICRIQQRRLDCSISNSRMTSRAIAPAQKTWRWSAASRSAWYAPTRSREASNLAVKPLVGTRTSCSKSSSSNDR